VWILPFVGGQTLVSALGLCCGMCLTLPKHEMYDKVVGGMGPAYLPVAAGLRRCVHRIGFEKNVDVLAYPVGYRPWVRGDEACFHVMATFA